MAETGAPEYDPIMKRMRITRAVAFVVDLAATLPPPAQQQWPGLALPTP